MKEKIKNCFMCDGKCYLRFQNDIYFIECSRCHMKSVDFENRDELIKKWKEAYTFINQPIIEQKNKNIDKIITIKQPSNPFNDPQLEEATNHLIGFLERKFPHLKKENWYNLVFKFSPKQNETMDFIIPHVYLANVNDNDIDNDKDEIK